MVLNIAFIKPTNMAMFHRNIVLMVKRFRDTPYHNYFDLIALKAQKMAKLIRTLVPNPVAKDL